MLALKTNPTNANIYLNNQLQNGTSPLYLNDLDPNVYTVRAELPGYFPWTKNLEVRSRASTLAYDITLFKQSKQRVLVEGVINGYALDRTETHLAVVRNARTIEIFSASGETQATLYTAPKKNLQQVAVSWSANNAYLLIENLTDPSASLVVPTDGKRPARTLTTHAGSTIIYPQFDNENSETLYGMQNTALIKISLPSLETLVLQAGVTSFEVTPLGVIAIHQTQTGVEVIRFSNRLIVQAAKKLTTLPQGTYALLPGSAHNMIAVANTAQNKIILIDTKNTSDSFVELNARAGSFGNGAKNEVFLAYGEDEVNVFNFANGQSMLLGRYGKAPSTTIPLYNTTYYLLYIDGELRVTELDDRDKRNTITLLSDHSMSNIRIDKLSTKIFYTAPAGLFVLEIQ